MSVWFEHSECSETHSSGGRPTGSASRLSRAHESRVESEPRVPKARAAHPRRYRGFDPEREAVLQVWRSLPFTEILPRMLPHRRAAESAQAATMCVAVILALVRSAGRTQLR